MEPFGFFDLLRSRHLMLFAQGHYILLPTLQSRCIYLVSSIHQTTTFVKHFFHFLKLSFLDTKNMALIKYILVCVSKRASPDVLSERVRNVSDGVRDPRPAE